jgi:hypothetical protein
MFVPPTSITSVFLFVRAYVPSFLGSYKFPPVGHHRVQNVADFAGESHFRHR